MGWMACRRKDVGFVEKPAVGLRVFGYKILHDRMCVERGPGNDWMYPERRAYGIIPI